MELSKSDYIRLINNTKFVSNKFIDWLLKKFDIGAITFGNYVFITKFTKNYWKTLVLHELIHVQQYINHGFSGFIIIYLFHFCKGLIKYKNWNKAYVNVPFEVEAYEYPMDIIFVSVYDVWLKHEG